MQRINTDNYLAERIDALGTEFQEAEPTFDSETAKELCRENKLIILPEDIDPEEIREIIHAARISQNSYYIMASKLHRAIVVEEMQKAQAATEKLCLKIEACKLAFTEVELFDHTPPVKYSKRHDPHRCQKQRHFKDNRRMINFKKGGHRR